jgi:hypothetical protein
MLELSNRLDSPADYTQATLPDFSSADDTEVMDSITGKLKHICPSLYFSLSAWERDQLDSSSTLVMGALSTHL